MKYTKKPKGVIVPMVSPFTTKGKIDTHAVQKIVRYHIKAGVALFIMGTTGEGLSISNKERIHLAQAVTEKNQGQITVFAGISHHSFEASVELARKFFECGIDVVSAHPPSYYPMTDDHVLNYYRRLADAVPGPLLLYNIPQTAGTSISVDVAEKLSQHENICGIKDSERSLSRLEQVAKLWKDRADFMHFSGWAAQSMHALSIGLDGIVPGAANVAPHLYVQLYEAVSQGNDREAKKLQQASNIISKIYGKHGNLSQSFAALKVMMEYFGLCSPFVLPPIKVCTKKERQEIRADMATCEQLNYLNQVFQEMA